jgi:hypothetical protein
MERSLRQIEGTVHWTEGATLEALGSIFTRERIEKVLERVGIMEVRIRKTSMVLTVLLCIAMSLFTEEAIDDVMVKLVQGPRFLLPAKDIQAAGASAISQRRQQLGIEPLVALFQEVCQPLATRDTCDAFLFGLRLMAIDGTVEDVADTPANASYFGRQTGSRGDSAFPQVRCVYLCECGTHAICDANFTPYGSHERGGGLLMLRSVKAGMLVTWDRGFHSYVMCVRCRKQQAHFLGRVPAHVRFVSIRRFQDGSYLAYLRPSDYQRRKSGERMLVRVIEYTLDDPGRPGHGQRHRLVTSLLNPLLYPAHDLAVAYHERWEVEITIDETDTHQRRPLRPLRSRTPLGVFQELYGLLLSHYAIRSVMHEAALSVHIAPDRLSFVNALRILRNAVFEFQIIDPSQSNHWYQRLLRDIAREQLPQRDNRCNPRVVKRKMSKFALKREQHRHPPQPTKSFSDAVVVLI